MSQQFGTKVEVGGAAGAVRSGSDQEDEEDENLYVEPNSAVKNYSQRSKYSAEVRSTRPDLKAKNTTTIRELAGHPGRGGGRDKERRRGSGRTADHRAQGWGGLLGGRHG